MLKLYSAYADLIAAEIAGGGPHAARSSGVKYMRGVKRSVLRLVEVSLFGTYRLLSLPRLESIPDPSFGPEFG